jgi:hypothetical protein
LAFSTNIRGDSAATWCSLEMCPLACLSTTVSGQAELNLKDPGEANHAV